MLPASFCHLFFISICSIPLPFCCATIFLWLINYSILKRYLTQPGTSKFFARCSPSLFHLYNIGTCDPGSASCCNFSPLMLAQYALRKYVPTSCPGQFPCR